MSAAPPHASPKLELPVVDLAVWLDAATQGSPAAAAACETVAASLRETGILIVRDPRVSEADNDAFLDMVEAYFAQPDETLDADTRPELSYQVGRTPSHVELPRDHCARFKAAKAADRPVSLCPPEKDAKARFFWRIGSPPADTKFPQLNAAPVVPAGFPHWSDVMNGWGGKLLGAVGAVAEMAAVGFGLPADALTSRMVGAPHLLAPTASDLGRFGALGTVLAGVHYDLNALTIHGRSRYPGLYVWTRSGERRAVAIPPGCLLVQVRRAGRRRRNLRGGGAAHLSCAAAGPVLLATAAAARTVSEPRITLL
jgi:isopenicillin N synthase-like dioxygenase